MFSPWQVAFPSPATGKKAGDFVTAALKSFAEPETRSRCSTPSVLQKAVPGLQKLI
jgi:hypothetical protein